MKKNKKKSLRFQTRERQRTTSSTACYSTHKELRLNQSGTEKGRVEKKHKGGKNDEGGSTAWFKQINTVETEGRIQKKSVGDENRIRGLPRKGKIFLR